MERMFKIGRYIAILAVIFFVVAYFLDKKKTEEIYKRDPKICTYVKDDGYMYNEILGGIHDAKFTIINNCEFAVKDIRVVATYIRKNGNTFKQEFVDVGFVAANSRASFAAPDSDAGMSLTYEIYSINSN